MSEKHDADKNAEETLLTLEQLSQTLEVMTCVVDRLKAQVSQHISLEDSLDPLEQALLEDLELELHSGQQEHEGDMEGTLLEISCPDPQEEGDQILH